MTFHFKLAAGMVAALAGTGILCPICSDGVPVATAQAVAVAQPPGDTATVRLHISGMTCGSCPVTARVALKKMAGVFDAKVTLDDSLGVVRYDPHLVSPEEIAAHLTKLTAYGARIIGERARAGA